MSYHKPIQLIPPAILLLNQIHLSACLTKLFAYAKVFALHHSIKSLPASFILPTPKSPHTPITFNQQPYIPTHTQLALQVTSAALQANLVRHPDRLVHGHQPSPSDRHRRHPLINSLLVPLLNPLQQRCSPQQTPRLSAVHQRRPVLILPHPDHPLPKKLRNQNYLPSSLLHPLSHPPQPTPVLFPQRDPLQTEPPPPARPPTSPLPALRSLLLPYLLSLLALLFSAAFPLPPLRSRVLFHCLQPLPHFSFHSSPIPLTAGTNSAPAPSPARHESKGAYAYFL